MTSQLKIEGLDVRYGDYQALHQISFTLEPGKIGCMLGPSGCGKTTVLRAIAGFEAVSNGRILIDQREVSTDRINLPPESRHIGMVFQGSALFDSMTIVENVMFPLRMFTKQNKSEMEDRVDFVLKRVNLPDAHNKMPSEASGGMQKRVAIARAFVTEPKLLLADEPTGNLDSATGVQIIELMFELNREHGTTLVLGTHDDALSQRCSRQIRLADGKLVQ